ncbi:hypothetical protein ACJZ2D_016886 [Fusarium nematophilum]
MSTSKPTSKPISDILLLTNVTVDDNVVAAIPGSIKSANTTPHGVSCWSSPLRVDVEYEEGHSWKYFVKIAAGELGKSMLRGEFESLSICHSLSPGFVVKPVAWGICSSAADTYFLITEFHELLEEPLDMRTFCAKAAELHMKGADLFESKAAGIPIHGRFGFHITTHMGMLPQDNRWAETWEAFFLQSFGGILALEKRAQGPSDMLDILARKLVEKVIPRLLRPLETEGRSIRPTLVHGDLQTGNAKTDATTMKPIIYDAGSFWGHHESDIGKWRPARFKMGKEYIEEYHRHMPKSEPQEDWEDRNILYSIRFNLMSSAHFAGEGEKRRLALDDMQYLGGNTVKTVELEAFELSCRGRPGISSVAVVYKTPVPEELFAMHSFSRDILLRCHGCKRPNRTFLLGMPQIEGRHSGENLAGRVSEIIHKYGFEGRVGYFVTDNAESNDTCLDELATVLGFNKQHTGFGAAGISLIS